MKKLIPVILSISVITLVGAGLRLYKLNSAPPSANWDEASYGYNAYSLWKTGRDEYGTPLPIAIRSFDDFKPPLYAYATAPIVGIFGLNEFNTRLVSAISGILIILVTFGLSAKWTKDIKVGLVTAAIVATAPWSAHYSRLAFEAVPALLLLLISWWFLLEGEKKPSLYAWAIGFSTLAYFSYNSHKVYWLLTAVWIGWKLRYIWKREVKLLLTLLGLCIPIAASILLSNTLARFSTTSVLPLWRETHSPYLFAGELADRYTAYFSPTNIFVRGTNEPNQKVFNLAVFYPFMAVFYGIGGIWIIKHRRQHPGIVYWWLAAPLPAAITWSWFTPIRDLPLWWIVSLIIAIGSRGLLRIIANRWIRIATAAITLAWWGLSIWWYTMAEMWYMPFSDYGQWQWGFRETIAAIQPLAGQYDYVVWETPQAQPHIFTLYYSKTAPADYQNYLKIHPVATPRDNYDIPGYKFRKIYWPEDRYNKRVLFIGSPYSLPESDITRDKVKIIKDIIDPQGYIAYRIVGY